MLKLLRMGEEYRNINRSVGPLHKYFRAPTAVRASLLQRAHLPASHVAVGPPESKWLVTRFEGLQVIKYRIANRINIGLGPQDRNLVLFRAEGGTKVTIQEGGLQ